MTATIEGLVYKDEITKQSNTNTSADELHNAIEHFLNAVDDRFNYGFAIITLKDLDALRSALKSETDETTK